MTSCADLTYYVLGIEDQPPGDQEFVYKEFKDQTWKVGHSTLDNKKAGSLITLEESLEKTKEGPREI